MQLLSLLFELLPQSIIIQLDEVHEIQVLNSDHWNVVLIGDHHGRKGAVDDSSPGVFVKKEPGVQVQRKNHIETYLRKLSRVQNFQLLIERDPDKRDLDTESENLNALFREFKDSGVVLCDIRPGDITDFQTEMMLIMDDIYWRVRDKRRNPPPRAYEQWSATLNHQPFKKNIQHVLRTENIYLSHVLPRIQQVVDRTQHIAPVNKMLMYDMKQETDYFSKEFRNELAAAWSVLHQMADVLFCEIRAATELPPQVIEIVRSFLQPLSLPGPESVEFWRSYWKDLVFRPEWRPTRRKLEKWRDHNVRLMDIYVQAHIFQKPDTVSVFLGGWHHVKNIAAFLTRSFGGKLRFNHMIGSPFKGPEKEWNCPFVPVSTLTQAISLTKKTDVLTS